MSPVSLTNLQVAIGRQNVLNSTLNMTYENFLQQANLAEQLASSDFGVSTGLISQVKLRGCKLSAILLRSTFTKYQLLASVSFTNNSNVPIDVIIFTFYSDQLTIDVETGSI